MQQRVKLLEKISITQRQALLTTLALYFLGMMMLIAAQFAIPTYNATILRSAGLLGVFVFGATWFLYYKYNWEPVRYFVAISITLLIALFLPEPFLSRYAPMAITIPIVLSLVVGGGISVIMNSVLLMAILLVRAGGSGVYAQPATLTAYALIVGGLLVRRLIEVSSLHQLKQAQETVKQSEQQMRALVASLDDIIFQFDEHGNYINVWTAEESLLFRPKDQLLGKSVSEVLGEEQGRPFKEAIRRVLSSGQAESMEYFLDVIGGRRWFNARINPIQDQGAQRTVSMLIRDITEQKQMEDAYAAGQKRFQSLIEHAPDGIALLDHTGHFKQVTPSAENILGYEPSESEGQDPAVLTHPEDLPALLALLGDLMQTPGKVVRAEYRFRHKDGSWRWLESTISNLLAEPSVQAIVFNYRDITERKQAEAVLQASEERYRRLFEENPLPLWLYDIGSLRFLAVNDAAVAHYGYERDEFLNMTIREIRPAEELPRLEAYLKQHRRPQERSGPWKYRKKDGTLVDVEVISHDTFLEGKPARLVLTNDITEQLQAKAALATSELRFRSLIENSADGITVVDYQGTVTYVSPSVERLLGYTPAEAVGRQAMDFVHREDRLRLMQNVALLHQSGTGHQVMQYRFKHKDGSWHWLESTLAHQDDSGTGQGIVFNYRDVTDRKQAEADLQASESRYRLATRATNDVIWEWNAVTNRLAWAENAQIVFGYSPEEIADTGWWDSHIHPEDRQHVTSGLEKLIKGSETVWSDEYRFILKDGRQAIFSDRGYVERDATGKAVRMIGAVSDITRRKQVEEDLHILNLELEKRVTERTTELNQSNAELEHANRAKDEFLANMSHELRTPLNSILGLSESLLEQRRGPLNDHQQKSMRVIESSGTHLLALINDILDLSKIEAGKFDFYPERILVNDLIQSSLAFIKGQALKKSIKLHYEADPKVSSIHADPRRLKQILVNLLTNAVKFTPEGGQVMLQVRADASENLLRFSVIDTGIGIAAKDLERLFRPFEQVDSQLNRQFEGTGLGLALVQKLTDLHGGSVEVESEIGKGSSFTINLPWEKETDLHFTTKMGFEKHAPALETSVAREESVKPITILLAEDHVTNILTIGEYFESYGYRVVVAHDGVEALEKAQEVGPDLILMDIQMPAIDGLEATRRLRAQARFAHTPIVALTALAMPGDHERCLQAGANEYMSKPVSLKGLVKLIQELLLQRNLAPTDHE